MIALIRVGERKGRWGFRIYLGGRTDETCWSEGSVKERIKDVFRFF